MKKRILSLMLCTMLVVSLLAGCTGSDDGEEKKETAETTKTEDEEDSEGKQKITIAIGNAYPPFCYLDESENPAGYEYDLYLKVAEKMADKYDVEVVCDTWDNLFVGLESGKYDIVSHHLGYNEERAEKYTVSGESLMYFGSYRFIYKKGRKYITDIASTAGMTLSNNSMDNIGKALAAYNEDNPDNPIILQETMPSDEAILAGIENGLYDAYTHTYFDVKTRFIDKYPDADIEIGTVNLLGDDADCGTYALFKKDNTKLQEEFDAVIKELRDEGAVKEISMNWFDEDYSVVPQ